MDRERLSEMIQHHEGLRLKPYKCSAGKLTIGYGRNLDDVGISQREADFLFGNDLQAAITQTKRLFGSITFADLSDARQEALVDMMFNMGYSRLSGFKKMIKAIKLGDFQKAGAEAMDSKWYKQVGSRAQRIVFLIEQGEYPV